MLGFSFTYKSTLSSCSFQIGVCMISVSVLKELQQLPGFKPCGKDQYEAQCPGHEDKKASLSIGIGNDSRILLHCHAGCKLDTILKAAGIEKRALFLVNGNSDDSSFPAASSHIIASYDYVTETGELLYQVVRYEPKNFRQRRPDGKGGWNWSTKGIKRVPYNLTELLKTEYPWIVEGEKDVESLEKIGLTSTCNACGAGNWTQELSDYFLKNQNVTIIPDNDEPGRKHGDQVARSLYGKVASIKIVELDGLQDKGDVSDWLIGKEPMSAAEELCRLSEAAPEWTPSVKDTKPNDNPISGRIRDYVNSIEGTFTTAQLYSDLGLTTTSEKTAARQALMRIKGSRIQPHGNHAGHWRVIRGDVVEMDFSNIQTEELCLWLPFDLHNYVSIMPGNIIVITGDPDAGKTAALLNIIKRNIEKWSCNYFNSEMGKEELFKRLALFNDFPIKHPNFHAYERSNDFQDVIQPGKYSLNIIDYLEITDEFYLIGKHINDIHKVLGESVAIIAIQKKNRNSDMPLGAQRALEKPRLAIALNSGSKSEPNKVTILKCKNRKTDHSLIGLSRPYRLIQGSEFRCDSPEWT
jgi:5S rRNA maturation endonuclease (ribonuclease M5)